MKFYKVGGFVRDEILGLKSKDLDFAVECSSFEQMENYIASIGEIFLSTPEYLTVRAKVPELGIADYVMCRKDGSYSDGRRPDKVEPGTIYDDLARRDFTINAIAIDVESGEYVDPHNGRFDITRKLIRCVGDANSRFSEDSLRMLRAIRFAITKGFVLNADVNRYIIHHGEEIKNVSNDRIREELYKCFQFDTIRTLRFLESYPKLRRYIFDSTNIWLKPTMREK